MITGQIILIPFPFAELSRIKIRPALVVCTTKDTYKDLIVCAISSVLPAMIGDFEMTLMPDNKNKLRVPSVIKIDRIATLKKEDVIASLGTLSASQKKQFIHKFKMLVE